MTEVDHLLLKVLTLLFLITTGSPLAVSAAPAKVPPVLLSTGHAACCLVRVGDAMPTPSLPDIDGNLRDPLDLAGETATVVVLWNRDSAMTQTLLNDLGSDVQKRFGESGVRVMGVGIGLDAAAAKEHLGKAEANFPALLDQDGAAFAKIGKEMLPRVYVLDAQGLIVWFDIEYSRATRRELRQTLQVMTR